MLPKPKKKKGQVKNGGNSPIKRKEGGQPGNKNAEKWTEERALELGRDLIEWMAPKIVKYTENGVEKEYDANSKNLFYNYFLVNIKGLSKNLINDLCKKYPSFKELERTAKDMQSFKMDNHAAFGNINSTYAIFFKKCQEKWQEAATLTESKVDANIIVKQSVDDLRAAYKGNGK